MIVLTLPYPISANRYWATRVIKKRGARASSAMTYVTSEAKAYKEKVRLLALESGAVQPIIGRVSITYFLHPHRPQDADKRIKRDPENWEDTVRCIDLDNAQKVLLDALKGVVIEDDKWVRRIQAFRSEPVEGGKLVVIVKPV